MVRRALSIVSCIGLLLMLARCAQVGPLDGGSRDTTPPRLLEAEPANLSKQFNSGTIVFKFDEFVQVKDLSNQLIVTPKLETDPEIRAEGKRIVVTLRKSELLPHTTYRLFFGRAIADMHESNALNDFEYVFSTGDFVDTLRLSGSVEDAFNSKPAGNVLVGLYVNKAGKDSVPFLYTPDYYGRSNESGQFSFKNLPYANFKVFAFTDKNKNSLYDGETEKIAFLSNDLKLRSDSVVHLKIFQEESPKTFVRRITSPYYGLSQIILNKKTKVEIQPQNDKDRSNISETLVNKEKDTVSIYYKELRDTLKLILKNPATKKNRR